MAGPSTSILDTGYGADANPVGGGWSDLVPFYSAGSLQRVGNKLTGTAGGRRGAYRNAATFGPDVEAFCTIDVEPANVSESVDVWIAAYGIGSTVTGYFVRWTKNATGGVDTYTLTRRDAAANVTIGTPFVENNLPGDRVLGRRVGSTVEVDVFRAATGLWSTVISATDATYSGVARIGLAVEGTNGRIVDFGGGTVGVLSPPTSVAVPVLDGVAQTWQTLTASTGVWNGSPTTYAYQWKRGGVALPGQTSAAYVLEPADEGATLSCTVTASNAAGTASATSAGSVGAAFEGGAFPVMWADPASGEWRPRNVKKLQGGVWVST